MAGGWSPLYEQCKLWEYPGVNALSGDAEITEFCKEHTADHFVAPWLCLQTNANMCHWGLTDADGKKTGGWSALYERCHLWEIPAVNKLSGSEMITNWCGHTVGSYMTK